MMIKYGQADYIYLLMHKTLEALVYKGLITTEQAAQIDELNRKDVFARFPSAMDYEVSV